MGIVDNADQSKKLDEYWDAIVGGDTRQAKQLRASFVASQELQDFAQLLENIDKARIGLVDKWRESPWEKGDRIGNYEILDLVGRGGMGVVYRAKQLDLNRVVAIKTIRKNEWITPKMVQRFKDEAATIARLKHPNIVAVHEVGSADNSLFFSMDFVEGESLSQQLNGRPLDWRKAAGLISTIAGAIGYAHEQEILHRDIKPSNVLLDQAGTPFVSDFGLAIQLAFEDGESANRLTQSSAIIGTPNYLSPEQATGQTNAQCFATDVYGLGATLYEMICGRTPFVASSLLDTLSQIMFSDPVEPRTLNPSIPRDLNTICLKCLEKKPEGRYQNALEFKADVDRLLNGDPIWAKPPSTLKKTTHWCRKNFALSISLLLLCLSLIGGSLFSTSMWMKSEKKASELSKSQKEVNAANKDLRQAVDAFFLKFINSDSDYAQLPARTKFKLCEQLMEYYDKVLNRTNLQRSETIEICGNAIQFADRQLENGDHVTEVNRLCHWVLNKLAQSNDEYTPQELAVSTQAALFAFATSTSYGEEPDQELLDLAIAFAGDYDSRVSNAKSFRLLAEARRYEVANLVRIKSIGVPMALTKLEQLDHETRSRMEQFTNDVELYVFHSKLLRDIGKRGDAKKEIEYRAKAILSLETALRLARDFRPDLQVSVARQIPVQRIYQGIKHAESGQYDQAFEVYTRGTIELEKLLEANPAYPKLRMDLAETYAKIADLHWFRRDFDDALKNFELGRDALLKTILIDSGQNTAMRRVFQLGRIYSRRLESIGRSELAAQTLETALENARLLLSDDLFYSIRDIESFVAALKEAEQLNRRLNNLKFADEIAAEHQKWSLKLN